MQIKNEATAKTFKNGRSQAVRLPKEFRLPGKVVSISHVGKGVLLQPLKETWKDVYNKIVGLSDKDFNMMLHMKDLPLK